ncbi:MAG: hypothetical protein ACLTZB_07255 [Streptococcus salivarius]
MPKHEKITVYPTRMGSYTLSVDNKTYTNRNVKKVEFSIDQRKISLWLVPVTQVSGNAYVIPLLETWKNEI